MLAATSQFREVFRDHIWGSQTYKQPNHLLFFPCKIQTHRVAD